MRSLLLLIVSLYFCTIHGSTISFDTSIAQDCLEQNGGCNFNNASIWINNIIPSTHDAVIISAGTTFSSVLVFLPEEYGVQVMSMMLQGVNMKLYNGSSLNITGLEVGPSSLFAVEDGASLLGIGVSNLTVDPSASFYVYGSAIWPGELQLYGSVVLVNSEVLQWGNTTFAPTYSLIETAVESDYFTILHDSGNIYFHNGLKVNLEFAIASNSSAIINSNFILGDMLELQQGKLVLASDTQIILSNVSAFITCPNGTYGTGNISIYDSKVNFHNNFGVAVLNGSVSVFGVSTVEFQKFNIRNLHLGASYDSVSIVGNGLVVAGIADGFGSVEAIGSGLNISGRFAIQGYIQANNSQLVISQNGTLVLSESNDLSMNNAVLLLGGTINGDVQIPPNSLLNTTNNNATINGNLTNNGTLHVAENRVLLVHGNFAQGSTGIIQVDLVNTNQSAINITDASVVIGGYLRFKLTKKPFLHSAKFPILGAVNSTISGNFNNNTAFAVEHSVVMRSLKLETEGNIIYIVYDFNPRDVEAWEWAVISVSGALIIGIAVVCILRFRARRDAYEEIPLPKRTT